MGKIALNLTNRQFGKLIVVNKTKDYMKQNGKHITMWHCKCKCGKEYDVSEEDLLSGAIGICKCDWSYFTPSNFNNLAGKKFGKLTVVKRAPNINELTMWECKCECGNTTTVTAYSLTSGNTQSCGCICSNGENKILDILKSNNIIFKQQKSFDDCRFHNTGFMARFDFYVNNQYIIEYDGEQHFKPVAFNGSENAIKRFTETIEHDIFKNNYCFEHKIPIIRIPYSHLDYICLEDLMLNTTTFELNKQNEYMYYIKYGGEEWQKLIESKNL